jgi:hypothetical protein
MALEWLDATVEQGLRLGTIEGTNAQGKSFAG